ncbi:hypothetical protein LTR62_001361 [Meristemomyces frigidus]|uniref:Uncharacterized protein n=1 Tax=Meristemomyces frigidus TaxID=1508187 RepID=A0AAN7T8A8_9PEZI|nr:hypothetical protein LTR62_001361 [Meristemomyces frigidus]
MVVSIETAAKEAGRPAPEGLVLTLDICSASSVASAAKTTSEAFGGKLDILIHNAGIIGPMGRMCDTDPNEWWKTWEVNVRGPFLVTRAFTPLPLASQQKTLVTISSVDATIATPGAPGYKAAKTAVCRTMEFAAVENADEGLIAFSMHPTNIAYWNS